MLCTALALAGTATAAPRGATVAKKTTSVGGWPFKCHGRAPETGTGKQRRRPTRLRDCRLRVRFAPLSAAQSTGPQPAFGLNEDWLYHLGDVPQLAALGADTSRVGLRWDYVEPVRGRFDWSFYDALIAAMSAQGVRPMLTIDGSPCWARPGSQCVPDSHHPPYVKYLRGYSRFVAAAVRRYPDVIGVEIWNEPNLSEYWWPHPQPKLYARMLKLSFRAVKSVNPRIPVVFAGLVPQFGRDPSGQRMDATVFQRRAYKAGAGRWTDAFAVHPYVYPETDPELLLGVRAQLAIAKGIAGHFGYPATPLWVTEFGLSSSPEAGLGLDGQAARLIELYETLRAIPGIPVLILHRLFDIDQAAGYQAGMGMLDINGHRKPAFCAIAAARGRPCPPETGPPGP
jgi:hypothetical protein